VVASFVLKGTSQVQMVFVVLTTSVVRTAWSAKSTTCVRLVKMAMLSLNSIWVLILDVVHAQQIVPSALIKNRAIPVKRDTPLTIGRELAQTMYSVLQMLAFVLRASRKSLVPVVMRLLPKMGVVIMALECALEQMVDIKKDVQAAALDACTKLASTSG